MDIESNIERLKDLSFNFDLPNELIDILLTFRSELRSNLKLTQLKLGSNTTFLNSIKRILKELVDLIIQEDKIEVLPTLNTISNLIGALCIESKVNQKICISMFEFSIRDFLIHASSFVNLQSSAYIPVTLSYCRTLCNMITNNQELAQVYLKYCLEMEDKDKMISRLLAAKDRGILEAMSLLVLNLISESQERCLLFSITLSGSSIFDQILLLASLQVEDEDTESIIQSNTSVDNFGLAYAITQEIIEQGVFPEAYKAQSSTKSFLMSDAQLTLLKFLDGFLQSTTLTTIDSTLIQFLLKTFSDLAIDFMDSNRKKDARDVSSLQAVILILGCLSSIGLLNDESRKECEGVVGDVVVFLRASETLIPSTEVEPLAIGQLKRSCVRLLGIVSWESNIAQDQVRETGGLTLLLGMCQINDQNITLREHALFAIRNVLKNNLENQALIEGLEPMYLVGKGGELRDLPPAMR